MKKYGRNSVEINITITGAVIIRIFNHIRKNVGSNSNDVRISLEIHIEKSILKWAIFQLS